MLRALLLLKWPVIIITIYLFFSSSIVTGISGFIKDNNVKKFEASTDGVSVEIDTAQIKNNIKNANELKRLANELASLEKTDLKRNDLNEVLKNVETKSNEIIKSSLTAYSKNNNRNHIIGNVMDSIAEFQYTIETDGKRDILVKVFVDKFPYVKEFNLCANEGHYKFLSNVKINKIDKSAKLLYRDEVVDCKSRVEIAKLRNGEFLYSFDLNILDGFNIAKVQGFDVLLPKTLNRLRVNAVYSPKQDKNISTRYQGNKLVAREVVDMKQL